MMRITPKVADVVKELILRKKRSGKPRYDSGRTFRYISTGCFWNVKLMGSDTEVVPMILLKEK